MQRVSVVGCGNMGGAFVRGLAEHDEYEVTAIDPDETARESVAASASQTSADPAAADGSLVVLAVKPDLVEPVMADLELTTEQTLISFAAGVPQSFVGDRTDASVARVMPNLGAESGSMAAAVTQEGVTDEIRSLLDAVGLFVEVDETLMDISTAVSGSGPAFAFYLINAVKSAGVADGLDPEQAETLAAQTFKGAAETVLRDDRTVGELIDAVCSPNGTTIEGMNVLWDSDADEAVTDAVDAAATRSRELSEEAER